MLGREFKNVPAFVVTDSEYRSSVPLLVCTNVLCASRSHLQAIYLLKPSTCQLMRKDVQYLGHLVSAEVVRTDPEKINRVKD